jgi:hypothetical protein
MCFLTSSFQHLARALSAIRQRQRHNLVIPREFDLCAVVISFRHVISECLRLHTLSRTTNGPLMPPMVLYRILGWTDIMRGSITSGMMAVMGALYGWWGRGRGCLSAAKGAYAVQAEVGEDEGRGQSQGGLGAWTFPRAYDAVPRCLALDPGTTNFTHTSPVISSPYSRWIWTSS